MGGVQRATYLVRHLSELGWKVTVLTVQPVDYPAYDQTLLDEISRDATVHRVNPLAPSSLVRAFRSASSDPQSQKSSAGLSGWLMLPDNKIVAVLNMIRSLPALIERTRPDVILTSSPPPSIHLVGCLISKLYGIGWVSDFRDVWFSQSKLCFKTPLHRRLYNSLRKSIYRNADALTLVSPGHMEILRAESDSKIPEMHLIPNGYDETMFSKIGPPAKDDEICRIAYCGSLNELTYVPRLFEALSGSVGKHHLQLHIYGVVSGWIERRIREIDPTGARVYLHGYLNHADAVAAMRDCDASLVTLAPDAHLESTIPGKIYEALRDPKPVIGVVPRDSSAWNLLSSFDNTILIDASTLDIWEQQISTLVATPRTVIDKRNRIDEYSWSRIAARMDDVLRSVIR